MTKEMIDEMRLSIVNSYLAECERLKFASNTIGSLVHASRGSVVNWQKGKLPVEFITIMAMAMITPKLQVMTEEQAKSTRRKRNASELILQQGE
jgi:hypothetical protein